MADSLMSMYLFVHLALQPNILLVLDKCQVSVNASDSQDLVSSGIFGIHADSGCKEIFLVMHLKVLVTNSSLLSS